jgi:formylglycine-generating enzyme required for sulfatase activity
MKKIFLPILLLVTLLTACAPVDLNAALPVFDTGVDPNSWAQIPAGEFYFGQHEDVETTAAYQIMITDVTTAQYAAFLNQGLAAGYVKIDGDQIVGYYPGDEFRGVKHEEPIAAGDWIFIPLHDPSQRIHLQRPARL